MPEQAKRWNRHFTRVLNIESTYSPSVVAGSAQQPVADELAVAPTLEELHCAIRRLRNGAAAGKSDLLPELLKAGGDQLHEELLDLVHLVWDMEEVPQDWVNCNLVPIPKKGNLSSCDNWRGIALLDVIGKAVAGLIQSRLQSLAEDILPDAQCGFRKGRSCTDMVFTVRQTIEKLFEH